MTAAQKTRARFVKEHYNYLVSQIQKLGERIKELAAPFEYYINLLCTNPGIDRNSATTVISEIGADMSQFGSSKRLCCWGGLTPGNNQSAGKKKSVRINRAGVYL